MQVDKLDSYWEKHKEDDRIWWFVDLNKTGDFVFSFDKKTKFYLFRDYPHNLTPEQKEIFDEENPFWKDFFSDRS